MKLAESSSNFGNAANVRTFAGWLFFQPHGKPEVIPLGYTQGGIATNISAETTGVEADQSSGPIIETLSNVSCGITAPLMEWTDDNILLAIPGTEKRTGAQGNVYIAQTGNIDDKKGTLRIHPTNKADNDHSADIFYTNVSPSPNIEYTMDGTNAQILNVEFTASPGNRPYAERDGETAYYNHMPAAAIVRVGSIAVTPSTLSMTAGQTMGIEVEITPIYATDKHVSFVSSDDAVATVSEAGDVYAVGTGAATITATARDGGATDTVQVTVT